VQLQIEYDPAPPFDSGSPRKASPELLAKVRERLASLNQQRRETAERVGKKLGL
jgi:cyclohexyl-isocyanide hydratase